MTGREPWTRLVAYRVDGVRRAVASPTSFAEAKAIVRAWMQDRYTFVIESEPYSGDPLFEWWMRVKRVRHVVRNGVEVVTGTVPRMRWTHFVSFDYDDGVFVDYCPRCGWCATGVLACTCEGSDLDAKIDAAEREAAQLDALQRRIDALESKAATARIDALDRRLAALIRRRRGE